MQVKKFEASTIQEAIEAIKREMGPEAVILQTKRNRKGFGLLSNGSFEVTAAVSERSKAKKTVFERRIPETTQDAVSHLAANRQADILDKYDPRAKRRQESKRDESARLIHNKKEQRKLSAVRYADIQDDAPARQVKTSTSSSMMQRLGQLVSQPTPNLDHGSFPLKEPASTRPTQELVDEVQRLKKMIADLQEVQNTRATHITQRALPDDGSVTSEALSDAFDQLIVGGMDRRLAQELLRATKGNLSQATQADSEAVLDEMATQVMERTEVVSILESIPTKETRGSHPPAMIALVGPTGVGKTTTLAKIASDAVLNRGLKVGLINLDTLKVGANGQLETYSKILKVPFRSVDGEDQLQDALSDFNFCDLILIDTEGRSQKDTDGLNQISGTLQKVQQVRAFLVLSATTRETELMDIGKRYSLYHPESLIFSKLDESTVFGGIYSLSHRLKLPLAYFTTGQMVPEDLEEATKERMAALLLDL